MSDPPRCPTCGWALEKVTFASRFSEFEAILCSNRKCPNSSLKMVGP